MAKTLSDDPVVQRMLEGGGTNPNPSRQFIAKTENDLRSIKRLRSADRWLYVKRELLVPPVPVHAFFTLPEGQPTAEHNGTMAIWAGEGPPTCPAFDVVEAIPAVTKAIERHATIEAWPEEPRDAGEAKRPWWKFWG